MNWTTESRPVNLRGSLTILNDGIVLGMPEDASIDATLDAKVRIDAWRASTENYLLVLPFPVDVEDLRDA